MKKYWPVIVTVIAALAPIVSPAVQNWYSAHPDVPSTILSVWAVVKFLMPSPLQK